MIVKNNKDLVSYICVNSEWSKMKMYVEQIPTAKKSFEEEDGIYVLVLGKKKHSDIIGEHCSGVILTRTCFRYI